MTISEILVTLEKANYEIATESRLVRIGLKNKQETAKILEKYRQLYQLETVQFVKEKFDKENRPSEKKRLRLLYFELAGTYLYRQTAKTSDKIITYFARAKVKVDGQIIPYHNLGPLIAKTPDFQKREKLQDAAFSVVEKINSDYLAVISRETEMLKRDLGFAGYLGFYQEQKELNYQNLFELTSEWSNLVKSLYFKKISDWVEKDLKKPFGELRNCHAAYLLKLNHLDKFFPKEGLLPVFKKSLLALGFDFDRLKNIQIDAGERPQKNPRAACYPAKVPEEIHLIIKPIGGENDYEAFFHEAGHSLHFAFVNPLLSYEFRHLAASHALTELFSFLFESLTRNRFWLEKYLGLAEKHARRIVREAYLADLFMFKRYLAKFSYEYRLFSGQLRKASPCEADIASRGPSLYAEILFDHTRFIYNPAMYLADMDGGFYSADYLRAWIAQAQLTAYLEKNLGENWFANKKTGDFLKEIWREGSKLELEEIIEKSGIGRSFDPTALIESYFRHLF